MVHDVEEILKAAVHERLGVLSEGFDVEVYFHVSSGNAVDVCQGEEDGAHLIERRVWWLSLYIEHGNRCMAFNGSLPYQCCADGDSGPMEHIVEAMWSDFQFEAIMATSKIEAELEKVAREGETGS